MWGAIAGGVLLIIFLSVMLPLGFGVSNTMINAYPRADWSATMNSTINQLSSQISTSFSLFTILPLIIAASILIAVLFGVFRKGGGR